MKTLAYILIAVLTILAAAWIMQPPRLKVIKVYEDGAMILQTGNSLHFFSKGRSAKIWPIEEN